MADELRAATADVTLTSRADPARSLTVPAVVLADVPTTVIVPPTILARLDLAEAHRQTSVTPAGFVEVAVHQPATVTVAGRVCVVEPVAGTDGGPLLLGQIVLDQLGLTAETVSPPG